MVVLFPRPYAITQPLTHQTVRSDDPPMPELDLPDHPAAFHRQAERLQHSQERQLIAFAEARRTHLELGRVRGWRQGFKAGAIAGVLSVTAVGYLLVVSGAARAILG